MFSFTFGEKDGFEGNLDFRTKILIDKQIENLQGSSGYIRGTKQLELDVYDLIDKSSGECLEYILSQIYENPNLHKKYASIIFEIIYKKQKNKKYEKLKKFVSSRNAKEIIEKENSGRWVHVEQTITAPDYRKFFRF